MDGFGYTTYDDVDFDYSFQSIILFSDKLVNARPYKVTPPSAPADNAMRTITAYPNPVKDILTIGKLSPADGLIQLDIVNTGGKVVLTQKISKGSLFVTASVANLPKGAYIALLTNKTNDRRNIHNIKFIKY